MKKSIGGYFELEIHHGDEFHNNAVRLNTARNSLRYIIKAYNIKKLYVPEYTCPVVWDAVAAENCEMAFYPISTSFMPDMDFPENAYILYTNYFGICSDNVKTLCGKYPNLIVDNSHSFYSSREGLASFNSARKFFGVPDGSYLFSDKIIQDGISQDISWQRASHLLIRTDQGPQNGYSTFQKNEEELSCIPISFMSKLTLELLRGIDYNNIAEIRRSNYLYLHEKLGEINECQKQLGAGDIPMVYPFIYTRKSLRTMLIEKNIFVPNYWHGQKDEKFGRTLERFLTALPIDQRYSQDDMDQIVSCLLDCI